MLVTDQWAQSTPSLRRIADTSLVYEPILEKYGYTSEDYQLSVDSYMDDPERFSRILRSTSKILDAQLKDLRKKQHQLALAEKQKKALSAVELPEFRHFMNAVENYRPLDWADSVKIELDTGAPSRMIRGVLDALIEFTPRRRIDTFDIGSPVDEKICKPATCP